ncbi:MAG: hypothetical protein ACRDUV_07025 [Pseudonocardiaceae bacterium]
MIGSARPAVVVVGRLLGVGLTAAMGWIHLQLWVNGFREVPVVGTLFLLNAIGAAVLAAALLVVPVRLLSAAAAVTAVFTAGTLAGLILSLTVGLFGVQESLQTPLVPATLMVESAGVLALVLIAILAPRSSRRPRRSA